MSNKPVIESLKHALADSYTLFIKTQNFHWNVTGPNFHSLHVMFEEQYNDLFKAIDEIAERIRALGEHAPGTTKSFAKLAAIKDAGEENPTASAMLKELAKDQDTIVSTLTKGIEAAQKAGDEATADLFIGRVTVHEKNRWMLKSSI